MKTVRHLSVLLVIAMLPLLFSCEFSTAEENDIDIVIICSGGATNAYTVDLILENKPPISNLPYTNTFIFPAGNITKATITVTRVEPAASLTIAIYNNNEFDDNGFSTLDSCTTGGSTTCTNTLSLQYEVKEDETKGTTAATTTDTSSSD